MRSVYKLALFNDDDLYKNIIKLFTVLTHIHANVIIILQNLPLHITNIVAFPLLYIYKKVNL